MKKKIDMQGDVFSGISAVYLVKGGITTSAGAGTITDDNCIEAPVSEDSGFNFQGGTPSVNHFKIHGMTGDWTNRFTPGDGELTLEIPCEDNDVLDMVYGAEGTDTTLTLPTTISVGGANKVKGKGRSFSQKAVYLGLLILNDTEDKVLWIKKGKFVATPAFDGGDKPYAITLTGALSAASDADAYGIAEADTTGV